MEHIFKIIPRVIEAIGKPRFVTMEPVDHADWKTKSVFPDRWPTIPAGTVVESVKRWQNFYGEWWRVIGPNGNQYDIEPSKLREVR